MVQNLKVLSVLHYVYGALVGMIALFMLFFVVLGSFITGDVMAQAEEPPPEWLGGFLQVFGVGLFLFILVWSLFIVLSGRWIAKRTNRTGSIIIAALCLFSFPFGTALGIFTLVVLLNEEVRVAYEQGSLVR